MNRIHWPGNKIQKLFDIQHPIIQAGMVWVSGWKLCAAASKTGCLGLLGAGSMKPQLLREHIQKTQSALGSDFPFGVNIPLQREDNKELVQVCIDEGVKVVFTSAGNPGLYTEHLKKLGMKVVHVAPTAKLAKKCEERGVDAVVCEGTEAGGHNGLDEIPTFSLVPQVRDAVSIPVIAAGGIVDGRGIAAALTLGADGVQIGTRFAVTVESSAADRYKQAVIEAGETDTVLTLKNTVPTRMIKNPFVAQCIAYERRGATPEETIQLMGKGRERAGIFEGNWEEGQFEAGTSSALIKDIPTVEDCVKRLLRDYTKTIQKWTS
ncbi:nitronate monooxygenase [bacterium]|nr:MAG: nitronate monooxygenase [bacterium]